MLNNIKYFIMIFIMRVAKQISENRPYFQKYIYYYQIYCNSIIYNVFYVDL